MFFLLFFGTNIKTRCIKIKQSKGEKMKKNQNKEQMLAIATLCGIFVLFLFLKMNPENPVVSESNKNTENQISKIVEENAKEIIENNYESEVLIEDVVTESEKEEVQAVQSFSDKELKRAQSYIKKRWAPDNTINMAAWDHAKQIKVVNNTGNKLADKKQDDKNTSQIVSSSN